MGSRARVFAVANQKGGVGKTTTAINLAAAMAQKGMKTLLIDLDPQGNSTMSYLDRRTVEKSMFDVLTEAEVKLKDIVRQSGMKNLDIAPARISLAKLESKLLGEIDGHFRLRDKIDAVRRSYDAVLIDTPPTLGMITVNAMVASSHILIPIQSSYFALEGTDDLLETIDKIKARPNPNLQILGVVITLHDKRTVLGKDVYKQIAGVFGKKIFKTTISKSVRLEESPAHQESIFSFAPRSSGAAEYYSLSEEVLSRV
jgi:chromosome partitioning protein